MELVIVPHRFQGKDCYRLCWGIYPTPRAAATAALRTPARLLPASPALRPRVMPAVRDRALKPPGAGGRRVRPGGLSAHRSRGLGRPHHPHQRPRDRCRSHLVRRRPAPLREKRRHLRAAAQPRPQRRVRRRVPDAPPPGALPARPVPVVTPAASEGTPAAQFRIRYDGGVNEPLGLAVLDVLSQAYKEYARRLGFAPEDPVTVVLQMGTAFQEGGAPEWAAGTNDGTIRVPVHGLDAPSPQLVRVLRHELAHSFIASRTAGNCPTWLQEGIAQWLEGGDPGRQDAFVAAAVDQRPAAAAADAGSALPVPARDRGAAGLRGEPLRGGPHHPHPRRGRRRAACWPASAIDCPRKRPCPSPSPSAIPSSRRAGKPSSAGLLRPRAGPKGPGRADRAPSRGTSRGSAAGRSRSRPSGGSRAAGAPGARRPGCA